MHKMSSFKMTMSLPFCNYATSVSRKCSFISEPTSWGRKVSGLIYCICMQVALVVKDPPADAGDLRDMGLGWEKGMAAHSSFVAWRIPLTEQPGGLQSMGSRRTGHDWSNLACMHAHIVPSCSLFFFLSGSSVVRNLKKTITEEKIFGFRTLLQIDFLKCTKT